MTTLSLAPSRDRRHYRLKCRFKIEPSPRMERLNLEKVKIAECFVDDMKKQGWDYVPQFGFTMKGPFPYVAPVTIHMVKAPTAREMMWGVGQGLRYRDDGGTKAAAMPRLEATEWWEFELAGVFAREEILTERPDLHEERG